MRTQEDPGKILENLGSCILSSSCVLCVVYLVFNILDFSNLVLKTQVLLSYLLYCKLLMVSEVETNNLSRLIRGNVTLQNTIYDIWHIWHYIHDPQHTAFFFDIAYLFAHGGHQHTHTSIELLNY